MEVFLASAHTYPNLLAAVMSGRQQAFADGGGDNEADNAVFFSRRGVKTMGAQCISLSLCVRC